MYRHKVQPQRRWYTIVAPLIRLVNDSYGADWNLKVFIFPTFPVSSQIPTDSIYFILILLIIITSQWSAVVPYRP